MRWCEMKIFKQSFLLAFHLLSPLDFSSILWFGNSYEFFLLAWNYREDWIEWGASLLANHSTCWSSSQFHSGNPIPSNSPQNHEKRSNNLLLKPLRSFAYRVDDELILMEFLCWRVTQFRPETNRRKASCVIRIKICPRLSEDETLDFL